VLPANLRKHVVVALYTVGICSAISVFASGAGRYLLNLGDNTSMLFVGIPTAGLSAVWVWREFWKAIKL
jgi:hypothetical protein